jgi:D-beta-D-heptose 7-phosphate kinase / D-beta-D-heptose 1-phosphate adenosyltransferase
MIGKRMKIQKFEQAKILVVGDVMLDRYLHGNVSRISPEAPVPVVNIKKTEEKAGGAGNVALNIRSLGSQVSLLGVVGEDDNAKILENIFAQANIESCLLRIPGKPTINKLRILGQEQQLVRVDLEEKFDLPRDLQNKDDFFAAYASKLAASDLVIFSDYAKGTLGQIQEMIALARKMQKIILVDPKSKDFSIYRGATVITPNLHEFEAVVGHCDTDEDIAEKALKLIEQHEFQAILVTRGACGMSLISKDKPVIHLLAKTSEVYDSTGAGDSVIATLGAALASGEELSKAIIFANAAAGITVKKLGATAVSIYELQQALKDQTSDLYDRIVDSVFLKQQIAAARLRGEKIIMTNGCFDILHPGHVIYLQKAKALGQKLIVAVNDDNSVCRLKGPTRPINTAKARMAVLAALGAVDWVVPFSEDTPENLIKLISPDTLVKGGDYQVHEIAGSDYVLSYGGEVIILPFEDHYSTTSILAKMKEDRG